MARGKLRAGSKRQRRWEAVLGGLGGNDIEAMALLVLMLAAGSAREDVKEVMDAVRQVNRGKARRRKHGRAARIDFAVRDADRATRKGLTLFEAVEDLSIDSLRDELDSMSELGELESLRLQMAMDRLSKTMSTLSNILKKASETADAITANLK